MLKSRNEKLVVESMVLVVVLGMTVLFGWMGIHRGVVLNLFFLPVIVTGYFLGRTTAGILALFSVLAVTIVSTAGPATLAAYESPVSVGLVLTVWAAVLGLSAILVGTLCDERARTLGELHRAYVGVVEVLSKYLQGGNPRHKARSVRIAEITQTIAEELRLPRKQVDDIRVAALLYDLGSIEITTQVISRAVDSFWTAGPAKHRFLGTELVQSLGSVLEGALPLIINQDDAVRDCLTDGAVVAQEMPLGARILAAARAYCDLTTNAAGETIEAPESAVARLRREDRGQYGHQVLDALEHTVRRQPASFLPAEPAYV